MVMLKIFSIFTRQQPIKSNISNMRNLTKLFAIIAVALSLSSCSYNSLVKEREAVTAQWANVETAYQRRADLIPNLVNTVKGAANFEQETLTKVIEARSKAGEIKLSGEDLTDENIAKFQRAQEELKSSYSRMLNVVMEQYPQLTATQGFRDLQAQLEGTENRISVERRNFNEAAQAYNSHLQSFPALIDAKLFNFQPKGYFKADAGSEKAPTVKF